MATDYSELRKHLKYAAEGNRESAGVIRDALPELLDEIEELRKGIDPWRRICARDKERIAQLEAVLLECVENDCPICHCVRIARAALEGKESGK